MSASHKDHRRSRRPVVAAFVLGFALSGFFDGILLHQVLQWHHFLSLVPGETYRDLRTQVYADGLFHVAVYVVALIGIGLLWRARAGLGSSGAATRLWGGAVLGFGVWNIVDVGFFHWVLGIHRIRVNVPNPMAYDLAWIVVLGFGVAALGGWILRRRSSSPTLPDSISGSAAAASLVVMLAAAAPVASIPSPDGTTLIVFRPGTGAATALNAIVAADGAVVAMDPEGAYAVVKLGKERSTLSLYRAGALLVTRSPALAGCLAFLDSPA